jgi:hypothetical protein
LHSIRRGGACGRRRTAAIKNKRYVYCHCAGDEECRKTYMREEQLDEQVGTVVAGIAIPEEARVW